MCNCDQQPPNKVMVAKSEPLLLRLKRQRENLLRQVAELGDAIAHLEQHPEAESLIRVTRNILY